MQSVFRKIIYCIPFLFVSCIQDYDIDYGNQNILTLNAEFSHLKPAEVLIALPKNPNQFGDYTIPSNAEVTLYENGNFFEQLTFKSSTDTSYGIYVSSKNLLSSNSYTIEASYGNLPTISANQKIPALPVVSNINFGKEFSEMNNYDTLPVNIFVVPNDSSSKYLSVYSYLDVDTKVMDEEGNYEIQNFQYRLDAIDDGSGFRDFKRFWTKILPASNEFDFNLIVYSLDSLQSENILSAQIVFVISAITEDGYLYRKSYMNRYIDNYGEPSIVYTNVKNGLGICSAKSTLIQRFKIK